MQVYKGLDVATNKVTEAETEGIPHHFISILEPLARYSVVDFRNAAFPLIEEVLENGTVPVVVGGTLYYIESLLWNVLVDPPEDAHDGSQLLYDADKRRYEGGATCHVHKAQKVDESSSSELYANDTISDGGNHELDDASEGLKFWMDMNASTEELYSILIQIDEDSAKKLHPNNRRKIIRSLQVWEQTGQKYSTVLQNQRRSGGGSSKGGGLRYSNAVIFWLTCQQGILDERLDLRVDSMMEHGLLKELGNFYSQYNADATADYTKGLFQNIGIKEFHEYLSMTEEERNSPSGEDLLQDSIQRLKQVTRRYSRRQLKWISNRLVHAADRLAPPIYTLDVTDLNKWNENVKEPALEVMNSLITQQIPVLKPLQTSYSSRISSSEDIARHFCEVCKRVFISELQWKAHLNSNKHKKVLRKKTDSQLLSA